MTTLTITYLTDPTNPDALEWGKPEDDLCAELENEGHKITEYDSGTELRPPFERDVRLVTTASPTRVRELLLDLPHGDVWTVAE